MWNLTNCRLKTNHIGHNGYLNCVTVSPDGSLCASGGKVSDPENGFSLYVVRPFLVDISLLWTASNAMTVAVICSFPNVDHKVVNIVFWQCCSLSDK